MTNLLAWGCRALEYVDIAAQTEPRSVYNAFLRLKIHLLQQDSRAASDQINAMLSCEDFSHEVLRVRALPMQVDPMHGNPEENNCVPSCMPMPVIAGSPFS